ncbi:MAG: DsbA family protein [Pseudomonadota bacterium]
MRFSGHQREPDDVNELMSRRARGSRTIMMVLIVAAIAVVGRESGFFGPTVDGRSLTTVDQAALEERLAAAGPLLIEGNSEGDVTIIELFDYRCPHCRRMAPVIQDLVDSDPGIRLVLVEYPILGPESDTAAKFAVAAANQDAYGPFHRALMYSTVTWTEAAMVELAESLGLDSQKLREDANSPETAAILSAYRAAAREDGIDSTPAFIVGDALFIGTLDEPTLRELVRMARSDAGAD